MVEPTESVDSIMRRIVRLDRPQVFRVLLFRGDLNDQFTAEAVLRGSGSYAVSAETAVEALLALEKVLHSLICTVCGALHTNSHTVSEHNLNQLIVEKVVDCNLRWFASTFEVDKSDCKVAFTDLKSGVVGCRISAHNGSYSMEFILPVSES